MTVDIRTLFQVETAERILTIGLELAAAVGLPVDSWVVDGASRTFFKFLAKVLANRDVEVGELNRAGFLSSTSGTWLTLLAQDVYGVTREAATYATPTVTLANSGGGVYTRAAGEVIVKASSTGVTFRSTDALSLASGPGTTATIALVADSEGSAGSVGADDIDEIVTTMLGVTASSSTAATGIDEQADASLVDECLATLGSLSENGPPDAYNAVALNSTLTGTSDVTRAKTSEDAVDGTVTEWIAGSSGEVSGATVTLVQDAIETWATPATVTPTVLSAGAEAITVAYTISGEAIPASAEADIEALVGAHFATIDIDGIVSASALVSLAHEYLIAAGATDVTVLLTDGASVAEVDGTVFTVGSVTVTEV